MRSVAKIVLPRVPSLAPSAAPLTQVVDPQLDRRRARDPYPAAERRARSAKFYQWVKVMPAEVNELEQDHRLEGTKGPQLGERIARQLRAEIAAQHAAGR